MSGRAKPAAPSSHAPAAASAGLADVGTGEVDLVAWHDVECGGYRADLALWRALAAAAGDRPILDVGAGTGRVALDLARRGHTVIAVDRDPVLLDELRRRAGDLPVTCIHADARALALPERALALCIVPMQTVQLLGGPEGRARFLYGVRSHLVPGGLLACAIVDRLAPFDAARETVVAPSPDRARIGNVAFASQPTAVRALGDRWVLERERIARGPQGTRRTFDRIEIERVSRRTLEREGRAAGMTPAPARTIPATSDHVASTVVMLRA